MGDRWLTLVVEREPEQPVRPRTLQTPTTIERRPVRFARPAPPPTRSAFWSLAVGVVLFSGVLAGLVGAWQVAASGAGWNEIVREAAEVREGLASRSQAATATLTNELAELGPMASSLAEVSTALEAAAHLAADLETVASGGPTSAADESEDALRTAGAALLAVSDVVAPAPATGFGPFVLRYPLPGRSVTDSFGSRRDDGFHQGIDIGAPASTPILAAADGVVLQAGWLDDGAGNGVILLHEQGWETRYFHMVTADVPVAPGDTVVAGQVIGNVGSTGNSTGPHLHFEIVYGPIRMDPGRGFTYVGRETGVVDPATDPPVNRAPVTPPAVIDPPSTRTDLPTAERSAADIAALAAARAEIGEVQQELLDIAADASNQAAVLDERRFAEQDRARVAALVLYGGAVAVALGLLLLWVTHPRRPTTR